MLITVLDLEPVSYTHLDVYKRQVKDDLQASRGIAADLTASNLAVVGDAHLIRHIFIGELLLGLCLLYTSRCV